MWLQEREGFVASSCLHIKRILQFNASMYVFMLYEGSRDASLCPARMQIIAPNMSQSRHFACP